MVETQIEKVEDTAAIDFDWNAIIEGIDTDQLSQTDVEALSYMLVGYSITESAKLVGISTDTLRRHINENKIIQDALTNKKKLMLALMLNKFQKQMLRAIELSSEFLLRKPPEGDDKASLSKNETSIYLKQITHAEWVMNTFMKIMSSNPLEGLSIVNEGGDMNIVLNVEGTSALDYLKQGMQSNTRLKKEDKQTELIANIPLLTDKGLPPYGTFGSWTYDQDGAIVCHVCGESFKSKQAMYGHLRVHNMTADMYADVYNVLFDELN